VIGPLLKTVEAISEQIDQYDEQIEGIEKRYPETKLLTGARSGAGDRDRSWGFLVQVHFGEQPN